MITPEIPGNEAQRLADLGSTGMLFTPAEERFDRITRIASRALDVPITLISLVAQDVQWFKSALGISACETSREISFCGHAILSEEALIVSDASTDPRFFDNPLVTGEPHIRFYAGQPIHGISGERIGTLCVIDRQPRSLDADQRALLRDLAAIAESELQRGQLSESQRDLVLQLDGLQLRASIDALTLTWNRAAVTKLASADLRRSSRGLPASLALIGIDPPQRGRDGHGPALSDAVGIAVRDAVRIEVAARIRRALREYDTVGRYDDDQFLAVFGNAGAITAMRLCQRIRSLVAESPCATPVGPVPATVSIGMVQSPAKPPPLDSLVATAETALRRAMNAGGNRLETAKH